MGSIPTDERAWLDLIRGGQPPAWRLLAEGSGGGIFVDAGVQAAIVPAAPERSVFNSVFYSDAERLLASLEAIDDAYDEAGVRAWTVWVPAGDAGTARALERAGHALDAEPRDMGMAMSELREPAGEPDPEVELVEREDYGSMARLNEIAYGYPAGDFRAVSEAAMPGLRIYFARIGGEDVSTLGIWPHRQDAVVVWVATAPEARGRGLSTRLLATALADAREAGLRTTTLQATKLGYPIYARLGYRDFGVVQMWERRAGGPAPRPATAQ
ncbi:MAG: GNAT family N-acetyltransferase [Solirubrobacterales bacterium]